MILEKSVRGTVRGGDQEGKENCWLALNAVVELDARRAPHHASISMPNPVYTLYADPVTTTCSKCAQNVSIARMCPDGAVFNERPTSHPLLLLVVPLVVPLVIPLVVPPVQEWVWQTRFSRCVRRVPL
jgi:hypothetical protein